MRLSKPCSTVDRGLLDRFVSFYNNATIIRRAPLVATLLIMLAFVQVNGLHAADGIAVFPGTIKLSTPRAQQRLVVERMVDGQYLGQVSEGVE